VPPEKDVLRRNRRSIVVDLRDPDGARTVLSMAAKADVLLA
jgi:alpha-methylacyl-CoA racemase